MIKINKKILEKELKYNNTIVLKYHIEYPSVEILNNKSKELNFNKYNETLALALKNRSENELYNDSVNLYKYNKENGYPQMVYEVYRTYEVTYNAKNIVSLYIDEYIFTGGAHGDTVRTSQTWDFTYNKMLQLYEFYPRNPHFVLDMLQNISTQISQNPSNYFDDACNLLLYTFNPKNFYLTNKGISIYFQHYDIAPYSSGIPVFNV